MLHISEGFRLPAVLAQEILNKLIQFTNILCIRMYLSKVFKVMIIVSLSLLAGRNTKFDDIICQQCSVEVHASFVYHLNSFISLVFF